MLDMRNAKTEKCLKLKTLHFNPESKQSSKWTQKVDILRIVVKLLHQSGDVKR